jgi:hypothetical protein
MHDGAMSGALAWLYFSFGGKPPVPRSASCSASPTEVLEGEPVKVTATGSNFNPKHSLTYAWNGNGAKISGTNAQSETIDTGMAGDFAKGILGKATSYTANSTLTDPKEKKNNTASCTVGYNDETEVVNQETIGAQRAVNMKYYMTTDELRSKSRFEPLELRKGRAKGKAAHFYFVPQVRRSTRKNR